MKRISLWMFLPGGLLMLLALLMLGAMVTDPRSSMNLPTSSFTFSFGALLTAAGFMFRARELEERGRPTKEAMQARQSLIKTNGICIGCEREPAVVRCKTHNAGLCGTCMVHHDTIYCEYLPCGRKSAAAKASTFR